MPETGQRRHHVDAVVAVHGGRDALGFGGGADELHPVAKPLDDGAGNKDRPFQRVCRCAVQTVSDGCQQAVLRGDGLVARVDDDEEPVP